MQSLDEDSPDDLLAFLEDGFQPPSRQRIQCAQRSVSTEVERSFRRQIDIADTANIRLSIRFPFITGEWLQGGADLGLGGGTRMKLTNRGEEF